MTRKLQDVFVFIVFIFALPVGVRAGSAGGVPEPWIPVSMQ